jgi:peptidoglycan hydrolase-like protein with peptidoglycan-binding domain
MDERMPRRWRAGDNFNRETRARGRRPDRHALWALLLAVFTLVVAAASAHAASGGIGTGGGTASGSGDISPTLAPPDATTGFGSRVLRVGMEGDDVQVLNGIVKSKSYASGVHLSTVFEAPTKGAVKEFQGEAGLPTTGVVNKSTSSALVHSMDRADATWYGPGFYGNQTACGKVLRQTTLGVAHKSLPCGTKVTLAYHGHSVVVPVIDRGPYATGYTFDLTSATAQALGVTTSTTLHYAVAERGSDQRGL